MKCPYCEFMESKVVDSRPTDEGQAIRRRRECIDCGKRFTTYEKVEEIPIMVVKKDGNRQSYDRNKLLNGIIKSCEKRPVSMNMIENIVGKIEKNLSNSLEKEVTSVEIGEMVMNELKDIDEDSYEASGTNTKGEAMDLFTMSMEEKLKKNAPLADRMRPRTLKEFVGQDHLVGENKFLNRSIKADRITSMIFYGPPGTGKTTLAMIIANTTNMRFEKLSAVTSGVKDIRETIDRAEENLKLYNKRTILFIDEIHRFNKAQQDALLPFVERGIIILIGATTENPYFEVNKALLSRTMVLVLESLKKEDLLMLINMALEDKDRGLGAYRVDLSPEAMDYLTTIAEGDGRLVLNSLEIGVLSTAENEKGIKVIDLDTIKESIQIKTASYDKGGNEHYDTVSAFIKSMRGSDPNATLYWLAKMIHAGEDPRFIARRIIIAASEDVGNADPNALVVANAAFNAVINIGMPEGRIVLAQAALYIAGAEKSDSAYKGIDLALEDIRNKEIGQVPKHLKDAHYKGAKKLGYGLDYKNPHDYKEGYSKQTYLPPGMEDKIYYYPKDRGHEKTIKKRLEELGN